MKRRSARLFQFAQLEARRLFCVGGDHFGISTVPMGDEGGIHVAAADASSGPESIDTLIVPALNSRPGAQRQLFLDFNGAHSIDNWGGWWEFGGYTAGPTPAYDIDGDTNSFTEQEVANIRQIWKGVAEKFSPFEVNVTTVQPGGVSFLFSSRVVIGGDGAWSESDPSKRGGGVALIGSDNFGGTSFVWGNPGNTSYVAEAVSHEAGHMYGLYHQSLIPIDSNEYAPGLIMGRGDRGIGRWADTAVTGGLSTKRDDDDVVIANIFQLGQQDDLARLSSALGYRADDVGNTIGTSTLMPLSSINGIIQGTFSGVMERNGDVDVLRVNHAGGSLEVEVLAAEFRRMLNPQVTLRSGATIIASSHFNTGSDGVGEKIGFDQLDPGTYHISISGTDGYGDMGQYRVNVRSVPNFELNFNNTLGTATHLGLFGGLDLASVNTGFGGTALINDTMHDADPIDFFKFKTPADTNRIFVQSNSTTTTSLAIFDDQNGNGVIDSGETVAETAPATGLHTLSTTQVTSGKFYFVRVEKPAFAPNANYSLRITTDSAPSTLLPTTLDTVFDPQPMAGGKTIYESIDAAAGDTIDYFRVTAKEAGLFSFYVGNFGSGSLYLGIGKDDNQNGLIDFDPFELLGQSVLPGTGSQQFVQNVAVAAGDELLIQVSQQFNGGSSNYSLTAVADYATGGNINGSLANPHFPDRRAATIYEYLDASVDFFDTFKIIPQPGEMKARFDALDPIAGHRLEIIYDANSNSLVDPGEVVASGLTGQTLTYNVAPTSLLDIYLRVQSVNSDEVFSRGNYRLKYATAGSVDGFTAAAPGILGSLFPIQSSTNGYLAFDPDDPALTDLQDYYQFTINTRTRFDATATGTPNLGAVGVQVGTLDAQLNFHRLGGVGANQGVINSLNVNLDPGTYILRTYIQAPERQDAAIGGNYNLLWKSSPISDNTPPTVTASAFQYEVAPVGVSFVASENVLGSVDAGDVIIRNLATNTTYPIGQTFYDPATRRLGYGVEAGALPDGNYRATLSAGSIRDTSANPLAADYSFDFFVFAGDANRDRAVNINDFAVLATHFNQQGTFSQGDFNYDQIVDIGDFSILASKFNTSLPVARSAVAPPTTGAPAARGTVANLSMARSIFADREPIDALVA